jgi:hypothetical protein
LIEVAGERALDPSSPTIAGAGGKAEAMIV